MLYGTNSIQEEIGYSEFRENIFNQIKAQLSETHVVSMVQDEKNNGMIVYSLTVQKKGEDIMAGAYLEEPYLHFLHGKSMSKIIERILEKMEASFDRARKIQDCYNNINEQWRSKVFYHLVNLQNNQKMLEKVPYMTFHDYAIVFRIMLGEDEECNTTMAVTNKYMEAWETSIEELWDVAYHNTVRNFPVDICLIDEVLESGEMQEVNPEDGIMHALTNRKKYYGAGAILYEGVLEFIGSRLKSDYYLLPSSIHEWMIFPKWVGSLSDMQSTVQEVNETGVKEDEILGTKVYLYDNKQKKLIVDPEE